MDDFVIRRLDGNTFESLYFASRGKWVNSSESASKFTWAAADFILTWCKGKNDDAMFDIVLRKDSSIKETTKRLTAL